MRLSSCSYLQSTGHTCKIPVTPSKQRSAAAWNIMLMCSQPFRCSQAHLTNVLHMACQYSSTLCTWPHPRQASNQQQRMAQHFLQTLHRGTMLCNAWICKTTADYVRLESIQNCTKACLGVSNHYKSSAVIPYGGVVRSALDIRNLLPTGWPFETLRHTAKSAFN